MGGLETYNEGDRVSIGARSTTVTLIELVVHDGKLLPIRVGDPALVGVRCAFVRCAGDDGGSVETLLVGDIVDRQGVLVVAVANVAAIVLLVRPAVIDALRIVNITILTSAAGAVRVGNIVDVDVNQSSSTLAVARLGANRDSVAELLVLQ